MSALRKMSTFLGYTEPEQQDLYAEDEEVYAPVFDQVVEESEPEPAASSSYETSLEPVSMPDLRRIVTVHPSTYNEARVIGESFRDGVPVIVNLTNMNESDARRMVDFSAGLVFGLHGAIERVTPRVFLLTPASVEIDGGDVAAQTRGRFANQG